MRSTIGSIILAIAVMVAGSVSAQAARWSCNGPEYVCGSAKTYKSASAKKVYGKKSYKSKYKTSSKSKKYNTAYKTKNSKKSYRKSAQKSTGGSRYSMSGKASYYWQPQALASGGRFNPNALTAAHKTLPFGTRVRVTNRNNGKSVVVTINDRGPYVAGRIIDLSKRAAQVISMTGSGVVPVSVAVLGRG